MGIKFNPLIFGGFDLAGGAAGSVEWKAPVNTEADLQKIPIEFMFGMKRLQNGLTPG
jgi:hypothetical protein